MPSVSYALIEEVVGIQKFIRVNERIRVPEVRVIGPDGTQLGVMPSSKGLEAAREHGLDLIEVSPDAKPPVCRIGDFSKYKYDLAKKERISKKHQHRVHLKEIRVKPKIEEHDYQVKLRHIVTFLKRKDKVKVSLFFRGREMAHQDLGRKILDRFIADSQEVAIIEKPPMMEGRVISLVMAPK